VRVRGWGVRARIRRRVLLLRGDSSVYVPPGYN
jgi:hypothetical protein